MTKCKRLVIGLVLCLVLIFIPVTKGVSNTSSLKVNYIDVGQADSCLIQIDGLNMLIDAGNREDDKKVINFLQKHGVKKLDYVVGTHPHEDHIGAMSSVLMKFPVDRIIMPKVATNTATFRTLLKTIQRQNKKIITPKPGASYKLGEAEFTIIAPNSERYEDLNNYSVVIRLVYKKNSFIFQGDAEDVSENEILSKEFDINSEVIKLGHHGSRSSSTDKYLDRVNPSYAIISCGKNNDYGHPNEETIKKLLQRHITFYRTDINGDITCSSDGEKLSFSTSKDVSPNNENIPNSKSVEDLGNNKRLSEIKIDDNDISNKNTIVYVTKSGKDYHTYSCGTLKRSRIAITLGKAIKEGYKPHDQCKAPILTK